MTLATRDLFVRALIVGALLSLPTKDVIAQESWPPPTVPADKADRVFERLFTPQPQYPTPGVTIMNGDTSTAKGDNPFKGFFTPQPQYPTPGVSTMNGDAAPAKGDNPFKSLFTPQPQYPTPGVTILNPEPAPGVLKPEANPYSTPTVVSPGATRQEHSGLLQHGVHPEPAPSTLHPGANPREYSGHFTSGDHPVARPVILNPAADSRNPTSMQGSFGATESRTEMETAEPERSLEKESKDDGKQTAAKKSQSKSKKKPKSKKSSKGKEKELAKQPSPVPAYHPLREALFHVNTGRHGQALEVLSQTLAKTPENAEAHYLSAVAYVHTRRYQEAAAEYRRVIDLVPDSQLGKLAREGLKKLAH